jgi:ribonuclease HII
MHQKWLIGIDEAGRGPLAGPVAIGLVLVPADFDWSLIPGVNDSKKLTEKKRELIYKRAVELDKLGQLQFVVEMPTAQAIDTKGIAVVIRESIATGLEKLSDRHNLCKKSVRSRSCLELTNCVVKLDGGLKAPPEWVNQETIIKGDATEKVIGLASVMAKVTRDRYMEKIASKPAYKIYDFAQHKGYGTSAHRNAIVLHGLSREHRKTYCKNVLSEREFRT